MYTFTRVDAGACRRGTWSDPAVHKPRQTRAHTHRNPPRPDTHSHPSQDLNSTAGLSIPTLGVTQGPGWSDRQWVHFLSGDKLPIWPPPPWPSNRWQITGPWEGSGQGQAAIAVVQQRKQLLVNFINTQQSLSWFSSRGGCGSASRCSFVCCCLPPGCREGRGCSLSLPQRGDLEGGDKRGCEWEKSSAMTAPQEETGVQRDSETHLRAHGGRVGTRSWLSWSDLIRLI